MTSVLKKQKPATPSEHSEQVTLIQWVDLMARTRWPELRWLFAIPNGSKLPYKRMPNGKRFCPEALSLLAEGMRPGVSDLFLPVPRGGCHGLFIEMKRKPNKPSDEQREFVGFVQKQGYAAFFCYSFEEAKAIISGYMNEE